MSERNHEGKTLKEKNRLENFNQMRVELINQGYEETELCVSVLKANIMAIVMTLPIAIVCWILYLLIHTHSVFQPTSFLFVFICILGIVIHELTHGIVWAMNAKKGWKAISFGVIWKFLTPYCCCNECLSYYPYFLGAVMPTVLLGFLPYLISLMIGSQYLLMFSIIFIISGGGDLYICSIIRSFKDSILIDHPNQIGCVAFTKRQSKDEEVI